MRRRRLSRWMPAAPANPLTWRGCAVLGCLGLGLLGLAYRYAEARYVLGVLVCLGVVESLVRRRRLRRRAAERRGENICSFARSFGRRSVDPWIIRAVYEELQPYSTAGPVAVPIRATDRLDDDIGIDGEELEDVAKQIAARTGRSLAGAERNPEVPVTTAGGLVRFMAHQPRAADA